MYNFCLASLWMIYRVVYIYKYKKAGMLLLKIGKEIYYREINVIIDLGMYLFISVKIYVYKYF